LAEVTPIRTLLRILVACLAIVGVFAIVSFVMLRMGKPLRLPESARGVVKKLEEATLTRGTYQVQLEWLDRQDQDFTNGLMGNPKDLELRVLQGGKLLAERNLESWRGRKSFGSAPVTFNVNYDPQSPITLELTERGTLNPGKSYVFTEPWPFSRTALGLASSMSFRWQKVTTPAASPAGTP
jgi:hypothetical protein